MEDSSGFFRLQFNLIIRDRDWLMHCSGSRIRQKKFQIILQCELYGSGSDGIVGHAQILSALFQGNHGGDFVIVVSDYHAAFAQHNGTLENAGVSLDKTGQFFHGKIFDIVLQGSVGFASGGDDVFGSVFAAGHQILNFCFGKQVGEDVLLNKINSVVLQPSFGFSAAGASWRCIENNHMVSSGSGTFKVLNASLTLSLY